MEMLAEFPQLVLQDREGHHYDGYITICGQTFRLQVKLPSTGALAGAQLDCDWQLMQILGRHKDIIEQVLVCQDRCQGESLPWPHCHRCGQLYMPKRLKQCNSLLNFLKELRSIVEHQLEGRDVPSKNRSEFCSQLIADTEAVGWNRLVYIDPSFQQLHLQHEDPAGRRHLLKLHLGSQYPADSPRCQTELPAKFDIHWGPKASLQTVYEQFQQAVGVYQEFWDMMDEIDKNTWVLEPEKPTSSATHRRLAVSASASVQLTVDPNNPRMLPECRFLGADQAVAPLKSSMNSNIQHWNEERSLLDNLQNLLAITFPSPSNTRKEEFSVECGICYAYRLGLEVPEEVCNDSRCGQPFHQSCLYEWLRALPSSRQSFNTIFGECPYCSKPITVKVSVK